MICSQILFLTKFRVHIGDMLFIYIKALSINGQVASHGKRVFRNLIRNVLQCYIIRNLFSITFS